jgi:D-serine deaminase-like pyridoxal phosphate-dependent protein
MPLKVEGFGHIVGYPDARLERITEEHGMLRVSAEHGPKVGDTLRIVPNHA